MAAQPRHQSPNHLVIVCGHAIWTGGPTNGNDESEWIIEDWKKGETPTYIEHIKAGLKVLNEDERALLVFSGGPTVPSTTESEAHSYERLAHANNYWNLIPFEPRPHHNPAQQPPSSLPSPTAAHARILLDPRALDSYQNILFSLLAFWRDGTHRAHWPTRLTIVSHAFKRRRLTEAHAVLALGFAPHRVDFVGINPPGVPVVLESEERAVGVWLGDLHGRGEELRGKRRGRNPHGVGQMVFEGEGERMLAGVETVVDGDGEEEVLVEGGRRPWAVLGEDGDVDCAGTLS